MKTHMLSCTLVLFLENYIYVYLCIYLYILYVFPFNCTTYLGHWIKASSATFSIRKILCLKVEKICKLKSNTTKNIFLQANKYVCRVNEWRFIIYRECWTLYVVFQKIDSWKQVYIVSLGEEKEKRNLQLMPIELWNHMKPDYIDLSVWTLDRRNLISYFIRSQSSTIYY